MTGRGNEPRKSRSRESRRARLPRKATAEGPKDSDWDSPLSSGLETLVRHHQPLGRESGDLDGASPALVAGRQPGEGHKPQSLGASVEESDAVVVPEKLANSRVTPEESVEERTAAKGKAAPRNASRAQDRDDALTHLERLGERGKQKGSCTPTRWSASVRASLAVDPRWEPGAGNPLAGLCPGGGPKGPSLPGLTATTGRPHFRGSQQFGAQPCDLSSGHAGRDHCSPAPRLSRAELLRCAASTRLSRTWYRANPHARTAACGEQPPTAFGGSGGSSPQETSSSLRRSKRSLCMSPERGVLEHIGLVRT